MIDCSAVLLPGLGVPELIIILVIVLIIFGPSKLPQMGKAIGQGMRALRKASSEEEDEAKKDSEKEESKKDTEKEESKEDKEKGTDSKKDEDKDED